MTLSTGWMTKDEKNAGKPLKRHPAVFATDDAYFSIFLTILGAYLLYALRHIDVPPSFQYTATLPVVGLGAYWIFIPAAIILVGGLLALGLIFWWTWGTTYYITSQRLRVERGRFINKQTTEMLLSQVREVEVTGRWPARKVTVRSLVDPEGELVLERVPNAKRLEKALFDGRALVGSPNLSK